ncbi:hypothetical protein GBA52_000309 [Prunus armeniaca]|nr:hypothetical protein GBA52_000309 [Prunus armeniaca]
MVLIPVHFVRLECNQSDLALKNSSRKLIWGLIKEGILGKPVNTYLTNKAVYVHPTWKLLCPDLSVFPYEKHDVKKCPC